MSGKKPKPDSIDESKFDDLDKVYWPEDGITKGDLIAYLKEMAPAYLPHFRDRPATLRSYPGGIHGKSFFRREVPDSAPSSLARFPYETATNPHEIQLPIINDVESACLYANAGALEFHLWASRAPNLNEPDVVIFDLDSGEHTDFGVILEAASMLHKGLAALGLDGCPKTSGGRGMHVYLPLAPGYAFDEVRTWIETLSKKLAADHPNLFAVAKGGTHRDDLVTIDAAQNSIGRNTAAPYTPRARPGAPVSAPLTWEEVDEGRVRPLDFTLRTIPARVAKLGDLFAPTLKGGQHLPSLPD
jgi:bifunctional non-homologous end joining protein LigD